MPWPRDSLNSNCGSITSHMLPHGMLETRCHPCGAKLGERKKHSAGEGHQAVLSRVSADDLDMACLICNGRGKAESIAPHVPKAKPGYQTPCSHCLPLPPPPPPLMMVVLEIPSNFS